MQIRKLFGKILCSIGLHDWEWGYHNFDWLLRNNYAKESELSKYEVWHVYKGDRHVVQKVRGCARCQVTKEMSGGAWMPWGG